MYCFHGSACPLGQPCGVGSWPPGSYLWNQWDSHSIDIYLLGHQKMNSFPLVSLSPIPVKWVRFPPYKYIFGGHQMMSRFHWTVLSPGVMHVSYFWNECHCHPKIYIWWSSKYILFSLVLELCTYVPLGQMTSRPNFGPILCLAWPPGGHNRKHKKCYYSWTNGWIISKSLSYVLFKLTEVKVQNGVFIVGIFRYCFN
jgi:hypothetical protein